MTVAPSLGTTSVQHSSTYQIVNLNIALNHKPWQVTLYATNLFDRQEILAPPSQPNELGNLTNDYLVNPPRQIGLRIGYSF
jgi:outer membrane receptor protein involved in Fe transport